MIYDDPVAMKLLSSLLLCKKVQLIRYLVSQGNVALCGLRNGAIVTVDVRQRQRQLARHRIPYPSGDSNRPAQKTTKPWFVVTKGCIFNFFLLCVLIYFISLLFCQWIWLSSEKPYSFTFNENT